MGSFVCSGFSIPLLTVFISVPLAVATPIFSVTTPGATSTTLQPGTYQIVATGAAGGNSEFGGPQTTGGQSAVVDGTFTVTASESLTMLVGGKGGDSGSGAGGGGGGGTFVFGPNGVPWIIAGEAVGLDPLRASTAATLREVPPAEVVAAAAAGRSTPARTQASVFPLRSETARS